jgi:hypothetical protein
MLDWSYELLSPSEQAIPRHTCSPAGVQLELRVAACARPSTGCARDPNQDCKHEWLDHGAAGGGQVLELGGWEPGVTPSATVMACE